MDNNNRKRNINMNHRVPYRENRSNNNHNIKRNNMVNRAPSSFIGSPRTSRGNNYNVNSDIDGEEYLEKSSPTIRERAQDASVKVQKVKKRVSFVVKHPGLTIGIVVAVLIMILFMFLMMVIDSIGGGSGSSKNGDLYASVTENNNGSGNDKLWWPIGSSEVSSSVVLNSSNANPLFIEFRSKTPVPTVLTSGYTTDGRANHYAIDVSTGGDVYLIAMADGMVTAINCSGKACHGESGYNSYNGNINECTNAGNISIIIEYNNGFTSKYLHVKENSIPDYIRVGTKVYQGQVVGQMGNTGCSTGQHLHLELVNNGVNVNPLDYVSESNPRPKQSENAKLSEDIIIEKLKEEEQEPIPSLPINGSSNKQSVCLGFKNKGYGDTAVAALMVNIYHESNFNPGATNYLGCVGLVQWCFGRKDAIKSKYGSNWANVNNQVDYIDKELKSSYYKNTNAYLNGNSTVSEKTYNFCMNFEVPGESYCIERRNSSKNREFYNYVKNGCK